MIGFDFSERKELFIFFSFFYAFKPISSFCDEPADFLNRPTKLEPKLLLLLIGCDTY